MTGTYFLSTKRLGFRTWTPQDLNLAIRLWGDPNVTKLFDSRGAWTNQMVQERLNKEIKNFQDSNVQYWPIFLLQKGDHVGACGLREKTISVNSEQSSSKRIFELGFHIKTDYWRQGFADEAAHAVIEFAFEKLKADGLFAGHNPLNKASAQFLLRNWALNSRMMNFMRQLEKCILLTSCHLMITAKNNNSSIQFRFSCSYSGFLKDDSPFEFKYPQIL